LCHKYGQVTQGAGGLGGNDADGSHWVGTWTTAPAPPETGAFTDQTLRMTMRASLGGNQVRVRILNAYGQRPLAMGSVHIALRRRRRRCKGR
jgi:hypothetical protein